MFSLFRRSKQHQLPHEKRSSKQDQLAGSRPSSSGGGGSKRNLVALLVPDCDRMCTLHANCQLYGQCMKEEDDPAAAFTTTVADKLQIVLETREGRCDLVHALVEFNADYGVRVRFCCAVDEYLATAGSGSGRQLESATKAKSIVAMFIMHGSMFQLRNLPPLSYRRLCRGERVQEELEFLRAQLLDELAHNCEVVPAIARVFAAQQQQHDRRYEVEEEEQKEEE